MYYRTFTGKTRQEALDSLNAEKKNNPQLKDARLIKDSEKIIPKYMGLKQEKSYEIIVGIPEHSSFLDKPAPKKINNKPEKSEILTNKLSSIEKSVISNNRSNIISQEAKETLFAINSVTKVAQQISQLEISLPKQKPSTEKKPPKEAELKKELTSMRNELKELKLFFANQQLAQNNSQIFDSLQEHKELPNELEIQKQHIRWIEQYLLARDFSQALIDDIIQILSPEILNDKKNILKSVENFLLDTVPQTNISLDNYQYGNEILFVGATGVGKTSTIVKLAAHLSLMRQKSCRFISIDKNKIGGETQLENLASYMDRRFYSVDKQEELKNILSDKNEQFTFIDTAGKSPKDTLAIQELSRWISSIGYSIDTHLVVSATTKMCDLEFICDSYQILNYNHILVTKLDETKTLGAIISLSYKYKKALSFVTDGQEIPQDFEIADTRSLIKAALK